MAGILEEILLIFKPQVQGSGFQRLNKQLKTTQDSLFNMKNLFHAFIGYDIYSGIKAFGGSLIQSSKDLGAMTSRFYAITKSEKLANEELQWTFDLADRTAMSLKKTADSYSIFYAATQKGLGTGGARQVFQDWTEVSRVLHLSEYQFERVTYALREMASKGAIYSQDLRMQIGTHVPNAIGLAEKAANELGITGTNWFEILQDKAKGNQKLINKFIVLFSKYAKEMYANPKALAEALKKPDAQIQMLFNHWQKFQYAIVKSGFEKDLASILSVTNKVLDKIVKHTPAIYKLIKAITILFAVTLGVTAITSLVLIIKNLKIFISLLRSVKGLKDLFMLGGVIAGTKGLNIISKLLPAISSLVAFMATPPGWVIAAILAIVGGVIWFKKTFPNAWATMSNWIHWLGDRISDFIYAIAKWIGIAGNEGKESKINTLSEDIHKHGGLIGNDKYTFGQAFWGEYAGLVNKMSFGSVEAVGTKIVNWLKQREKKKQQPITIKVEQNIGSVQGIQDYNQVTSSVVPLLVPHIKGMIQPY